MNPTKEEILQAQIGCSMGIVTTHCKQILAAMSTYIAPLQAENEALNNTLKAERKRSEELLSDLLRSHTKCIDEKNKLQAENEALRKEVERLKEYEFMYKSVSK